MIGTQDGFFLSLYATCTAVYRTHCPFPVVLRLLQQRSIWVVLCIFLLNSSCSPLLWLLIDDSLTPPCPQSFSCMPCWGPWRRACLWALMTGIPHFTALHKWCILKKLKSGPFASKNMTTCFLAILALLWMSCNISEVCQCSLYCSGLELNPHYLQSMLACICFFKGHEFYICTLGQIQLLVIH